MRFEQVIQESSRFEDSYKSSKLRDRVNSFTAASKKLDPMNPEYKETFKDVEYGYKGNKDDPEYWKHYKKYFMPKDTEADT